MGRRRKDVDEKSIFGAFAVNLRRLREQRGLTLQEFAEQAGIKYPSAAKYEQAASFPRLGPMIAMAKALGVKPSELLAPIDDLIHGDPGEHSDNSDE